MPAAYAPKFETAFATGTRTQFALDVLSKPNLRNLIKKSPKLSISEVCKVTVSAMETLTSGQISLREPTADRMSTHRALVHGLPGEAMVISSSLLFDNFAEAQELFDVTPKTMRAKIGGSLNVQQSELSLRVVRVVGAAAKVHGSYTKGREWLRAPNFALGGEMPMNLLKTADGERMILAELQAQDEGAPV